MQGIIAVLILSLSAELEGDVSRAVERTAECFSAVDCITWLQDLSVAYQMSWREKLAALEAMEYSHPSVTDILRVWDKQPPEVDGN